MNLEKEIVYGLLDRLLSLLSKSFDKTQIVNIAM